jgi:uncharacterized protein (TIGR02246 family)
LKTSKAVLVVVLLLTAALLQQGVGAFAPQSQPGRPAEPRQLSAADEKAIRDILKDQEAAWNKHDMEAFTKAFRDDVEGINVAGMYWRGKPAVVKHLTDFHATFLKDCEEYLEEIQVRSIGDGYATTCSIWKVDGFTGPGGVEIPAERHRSTLVLAKGNDGWKVVLFHNTSINEAALNGGEAPKK